MEFREFLRDAKELASKGAGFNFCLKFRGSRARPPLSLRKRPFSHGRRFFTEKTAIFTEQTAIFTEKTAIFREDGDVHRKDGDIIRDFAVPVKSLSFP